MIELSDARLDVRHILQTSPPVLDHVLPGLLAGTLGMLVSPGGMGKTMLLMQIGCAIASGSPLFNGLLTGHAPSPGRVMLFLAEETQSVMHHRIHGIVQPMVAEQERPCRLAFVEELARNLCIYPLGGHGPLGAMAESEREYSQLREICKGARLVIFDPLRRFHDGDENDSAMMNMVVTRFQRLAHETGAAVLLAHHTNRNSMTSGAGEYAFASRGSSALTDGVRWQANLSALPDAYLKSYGVGEDERRFYVRLDISKSNYVPAPAPLVLRKVPESGAMTLCTSGAVKRSASNARRSDKGTKS